MNKWEKSNACVVLQCNDRGKAGNSTPAQLEQASRGLEVPTPQNKRHEFHRRHCHLSHLIATYLHPSLPPYLRLLLHPFSSFPPVFVTAKSICCGFDTRPRFVSHHSRQSSICLHLTDLKWPPLQRRTCVLLVTHTAPNRRPFPL